MPVEHSAWGTWKHPEWNRRDFISQQLDCLFNTAHIRFGEPTLSPILDDLPKHFGHRSTQKKTVLPFTTPRPANLTWNLKRFGRSGGTASRLDVFAILDRAEAVNKESQTQAGLAENFQY
jgi:hypothetical protein